MGKRKFKDLKPGDTIYILNLRTCQLEIKKLINVSPANRMDGMLIDNVLLDVGKKFHSYEVYSEAYDGEITDLFEPIHIYIHKSTLIKRLESMKNNISLSIFNINGQKI